MVPEFGEGNAAHPKKGAFKMAADRPEYPCINVYE
jgi:hypothetical protein